VIISKLTWHMLSATVLNSEIPVLPAFHFPSSQRFWALSMMLLDDRNGNWESGL